MVTGTAAMTAAENYFGKKQCLYFDTPPDAYLAVEQGKAGRWSLTGTIWNMWRCRGRGW